MTGSIGPRDLIVLCCRTANTANSTGEAVDSVISERAGSKPSASSEHAYDGRYDASGGQADSDDVQAIIAACIPTPIHFVGRRPKKAIDPLLSGRILVVGDDSDLNAVVLRLLRKDLLGTVEVAYAPPKPTAMTRMYSLPSGPEAVRAAKLAEVDLVPLVRSDAGGVLVGAAQLSPVTGTFYVDAERIAGGGARTVQVEPHRARGLSVTVVQRRILGFGRQPATYLGRAVEFGLLTGTSTPTAIVFDGIRHPREANRWVFYLHTESLRLVRGVY